MRWARQSWWSKYWPFWRDIVKAVIVVLIFLFGLGAFRIVDSYFRTYDVFLGFLERDYGEWVEQKEAMEKNDEGK